MNTATISLNRQIGAIFMIVGTEVGAGILALPLLIAHFGPIVGALLMFLVWLLMTYTTFVVCEVNLAMPAGSSFGGMAKKLFASFGQVVVWLSFLFILYPILIAYISAAGSTFSTIFNISTTTASIGFVIILGFFVMLGTTQADWINRLLLIIKLALLLFVCVFLAPQATHANLTYIDKLRIQPLLVAMPVFVTAFTGHIIIPTIRIYLHSNQKVLNRVIWIGCTIPLILYLIWLIAIIGNIPAQGAHSLANLIALGDKANVGDILNLLRIHLQQSYFITPVSTFASISVSTSFLAVTLALKDFLHDACRLNRFQAKTRHLISLTLVFILPTIITICFADLFIKALSLVGLACTILLVIIPSIMIYRLRKNNYQFKFNFTHQASLNYLTICLGVLLVIIQIISNFQ